LIYFGGGISSSCTGNANSKIRLIFPPISYIARPDFDGIGKEFFDDGAKGTT
jgi:hypothetical protein